MIKWPWNLGTRYVASLPQSFFSFGNDPDRGFCKVGRNEFDENYPGQVK